MYGNPETTPGGRALKFYSSVRLDIRKKDPIKEGGEVIGNLTKVKVVKNKVAPPFREAEFDIMYGEGISREGEIVDLAVKLDIIKKSGSWYSYEGTRIGQGRDKVKQYFKENPEFAEQIAKQVMDQKERLMLMAKGKRRRRTRRQAVRQRCRRKQRHSRQSQWQKSMTRCRTWTMISVGRRYLRAA